MDILRSRTRHIKRTANDRQALQRLYNHVDHADAPSNNGRLTPQVGNPGFVSQFDLVIIPQFFTVAATVYTSRTAAYMLANHAAEMTSLQLPVFLFGNADKSGGYSKMISQFPLVNSWVYGTPFIYGADSGASTIFGTLDATAIAGLRRGDMVIPITNDGATDLVAFTVIRCTQTAYGSLLDATNSDSFQINMVRYIMTDSLAVSLAQYLNQIQPVNLSLFGKFSSDSVSPNSFKIPEQQQQNILDIPLVVDIDKQLCIGTWMNYDITTQMQLSFFVSQVVKVAR